MHAYPVLLRALAALVLVMLLAAAFHSLMPASSQRTAIGTSSISEKGIALVESARIVRGNLEPLFSSLGTIDPVQKADVYALVGGRVTEVLAKEGDGVEAGAVLARLDAGALEAEVKTREAERALAQANPALSAAERDLQTQALDGKLAQLAKLRAEYSLRAPFAGTVVGVGCKIGDTVSAQSSMAAPQPLFIVADSRQVYARAGVPERFISQLKPGMAARVRVGAYPLEHFPLAIFGGQLAAISQTADPATRTFEVRVLLDNQDGRLRPGMSAEVGLVLERFEKVLLVPKEAVVKGEFQSGVDLIYVIEDADAVAAGKPAKVVAQAVELGVGDGVNYVLKETIEAAGSREKLASALKSRALEGALVVTIGAPALVDGQLVRVVR